MRMHRDCSELPCAVESAQSAGMLPPGLQINPILAASAPINRKASLLVSMLLCVGLFSGGLYFIELSQRLGLRNLKGAQPSVRLLLREDYPIEEAPGGGLGNRRNLSDRDEQPMSPAISTTLPSDHQPKMVEAPLEYVVPLETPTTFPELQPGVQIPMASGGGGNGSGDGTGSGTGKGSARGRGSTLIHSASGEETLLADNFVGVQDYIPPEYPRAARLANISGDVFIEVTINENGKPIKWKVLDGHPCLAAAALEVLPRWQFIPVRHKGQRVSATFEVSARFTLIQQ